MNRRDFTERDIHMALDDELPAEELAGYEAWLDANPDMKARRDRFEADRDQLRRGLAGMLAEPLPVRLAAPLTGGVKTPAAGVARWPQIAAAAVILLAVAFCGYLAGATFHGSEAPDEQLAEEAIAAHIIYAAETRHAVEVGAGEKEHLLSWLSKRVGLALVAPDLTSDGFDLVGGRLLPASQGVAALLLYQDAEGDRVSVFVTAGVNIRAKGTYRMTADGPNAVYWLDGGYACAVVGSLPGDFLAEVAGNAYRQLVAGARSG